MCTLGFEGYLEHSAPKRACRDGCSRMEEPSQTKRKQKAFPFHSHYLVGGTEMCILVIRLGKKKVRKDDDRSEVCTSSH